MNSPECLNCDRRQICEPILGGIVRETVSAVFQAQQEQKLDFDGNPMEALNLLRAFDSIASSGDTSSFVNLSSTMDVEKYALKDSDIVPAGYSTLRDAGCGLDYEQYGVRLAQYTGRNMLSILGDVFEEVMANDLVQQIDEEERLRSVADSATAELSAILGDMDMMMKDDTELKSLLGGTFSKLSQTLGDINGITEGLNSGTDLPEKAVALDPEEVKQKERNEFIKAQGWDPENLDLGQKLEIKSHLRSLGLLK